MHTADTKMRHTVLWIHWYWSWSGTLCGCLRCALQALARLPDNTLLGRNTQCDRMSGTREFKASFTSGGGGRLSWALSNAAGNSLAGLPLASCRGASLDNFAIKHAPDVSVCQEPILTAGARSLDCPANALPTRFRQGAHDARHSGRRARDKSSSRVSQRLQNKVRRRWGTSEASAAAASAMSAQPKPLRSALRRRRSSGAVEAAEHIAKGKQKSVIQLAAVATAVAAVIDQPLTVSAPSPHGQSVSETKRSNSHRSKQAGLWRTTSRSPAGAFAGSSTPFSMLRTPAGVEDAVNLVPQTKASKRRAGTQTTGWHNPFKVTAVHGTLIYGPDPTNPDVAYISKLMERTGYSRRELYAMFMQFKALVALSRTFKGIDKETFCKGIPMLSLEDSTFVERVFKLLDEDGSQIIEWDEFLLALTKLEHGTPETRANFLFDVYDNDGAGDIDHDEMSHYFLAAMRLPVDEKEPGSEDKGGEGFGDEDSRVDSGEDEPMPPVDIGDEFEHIEDSKEYLESVAAKMARMSSKDGKATRKGLREFKNLCKYFVTRVFEDIDKHHGGQLKRHQIAQYLRAHPEVTNVSSMFGRATVELAATSSILEHNKMDLTTLLTEEDAHLPLLWTQTMKRQDEVNRQKRQKVFRDAQLWRERKQREHRRKSTSAPAPSNEDNGSGPERLSTGAAFVEAAAPVSTPAASTGIFHSSQEASSSI